MKKSAATLTAWEGGKKAPTFKQLETLAETIYHRPIALFFFPAPPEEPEPGRVFRTLPSEEVDKLLPAAPSPLVASHQRPSSISVTSSPRPARSTRSGAPARAFGPI